MAIDTDITIEDLTRGETTGNGDFDELMRAVLSNLNLQYDQQRISKETFATLYSQLIPVALQSAIQFTLSKGKAGQEILLAAAQVVGQEVQNDLIRQQILVAKQQVLQSVAEVALLNQKKLTEIQTTAATEQSVTNLEKQLELLTSQIAQSEATTTLTDQKTKSEIANISDMVDGIAVSGTVGTQRSLYQAQVDGFKRDAEQKAAKIMSDANAVTATYIDSYTPPTMLADTSINRVMTKLLAGIGA